MQAPENSSIPPSRETHTGYPRGHPRRQPRAMLRRPARAGGSRTWIFAKGAGTFPATRAELGAANTWKQSGEERSLPCSQDTLSFPDAPVRTSPGPVVPCARERLSSPPAPPPCPEEGRHRGSAPPAPPGRCSRDTTPGIRRRAAARDAAFRDSLEKRGWLPPALPGGEGRRGVRWHQPTKRGVRRGRAGARQAPPRRHRAGGTARRARRRAGAGWGSGSRRTLTCEQEGGSQQHGP